MKILAALVTHNRCALLSRCLDHLEAQVRPADAIVVINNGSTDDTVAMLAARSTPVITQDNLGSSGGWHRAIETALDEDFDAVWLMDDDGFPERLALAALEHALTPGRACASSIVVREDDRGHFVFPFPRLDRDAMPVLFARRRKIASVAALRPLATDDAYPFAHFFNGALIRTDAVRAIGNIDRDFFIFGEEVDYFFRLRRAGAIVSILSAKHYHPDVSRRPLNAFRIYYYVRNTLILNRRYFRPVALRHVLAVVAVLARTAKRSGWREAASYIVGRHAATMRQAIRNGLGGRLGRDFEG